MAELWCHQSVSPAPGKDVKEEWGPGGQDGLERSLRPQQGNPSHSHANHVHFCLWFVAPSQGTGSDWTLEGPQGQGQRVGRRARRCPQCQRDLGPISASQGYPGLLHHDIAVAKHAILPRLAGEAARYNFKERQNQGWGYRQVSDAASRPRRRSEEEHQGTTASGRVVRAQGKRGCSEAFS